jgi:hypothetical protein
LVHDLKRSDQTQIVEGFDRLQEALERNAAALRVARTAIT